MIESLSNYAFTLILSSFLMNMIQMILPNSNNRKYILFVCSSIIVIILITPVISFLNKDFDISNLLITNKKKYIDMESSSSNYYESEVINAYKKNLEIDIINTLEEIGYKILDMNLEYDIDTLEPNYLRLELQHQDGSIQPVRIEVIGENSNKEDKLASEKVKSIIKKRYEIKNVEVNVWKNY